MDGTGEHFLVTGAAGCIGAWTLRLLLDSGVAVTASDLVDDLRRFQLISLDRPGQDIDFVSLDVTKKQDVVEVIQERRITHVVHLAGLQIPFCAADPPLGAAVNIGGTINIFEAVKACKRRVGLAYASSVAVFGSSSQFSSGLIGDSSPLRPDSHYGVYKAANEGTARVYATGDGIGSIGLRPFVVYGPGRDQGLTSDPTQAMLAVAAGVPYHIKFSGNLLLTYAPDCASAFIGAARAAAGSTEAVCLNVPGQRTSVAALTDLMAELVPEASELITFDATPIRFPSLLAAPALPAVTGEINNCPLAEGVRLTINHFRKALSVGVIAKPGN